SNPDLTARCTEDRGRQACPVTRRTPVDVDICQDLFAASAQPLINAGWIAGDFDLEKLDLAAAGRRMDRVARPLHKERQLGIDLKVLDTQLVPGQHRSVWQVTMTLDRWAADPLFERSKIINCNHPAEPATTLCRPRPDRLTKWGFVGSRVIQDTDYLDIVSGCHRQDPLAGAEEGMEST